MSWERVNPCLLDRLLGTEGLLPGAGTLASEQPFVTLRKYAESVRRDLDWLVQARAPLPETELTEGWEYSLATSFLANPTPRSLEEFPETRSSVLCYGMPDLTGRITVTDLELENLLLQAVEDFEPRLDRESIRVQRVSKKGEAAGLMDRDSSDDDSSVSDRGDSESVQRRVFAVVADLWAQPRMERVDYAAEFDTITGPRVTSI